MLPGKTTFRASSSSVAGPARQVRESLELFDTASVLREDMRIVSRQTKVPYQRPEELNVDTGDTSACVARYYEATARAVPARDRHRNNHLYPFVYRRRQRP